MNLPPKYLFWILALTIAFSCVFEGCRKKDLEKSLTSKMGGARSWHGVYQFGYWESYKPPHTGQYYYFSSQDISDSFELIVNSDQEVMIVNNELLHVDTAIFQLSSKDDTTLRFTLKYKVSKWGWAFSPYNSFINNIVYYYNGDSILLSSGNIYGGHYDNFAWLKTP